MATGRGAGVFDGTLYAASTAHHRAFDDAVLGPLPLRPGARVLDLGCGVGDLTARVADVVLEAGSGLVVGVDLSPSSIRRARARWQRPGLHLRVGALQHLAQVVPETGFDAVMSVATLHWVPWEDHPALLATVRERLAPGGTLSVDMGGHGQIAAARTVLDPLLLGRSTGTDTGPGADGPWCFPDATSYAGLLGAAGLSVSRCALVHQRRSMPDAVALEGWLRSQVLPAYEPWLPGGDDREPALADVVDRCSSALRRDDGSYDQDYVRLDVVAVRDAA